MPTILFCKPIKKKKKTLKSVSTTVGKRPKEAEVIYTIVVQRQRRVSGERKRKRKKSLFAPSRLLDLIGEK